MSFVVAVGALEECFHIARAVHDVNDLHSLAQCFSIDIAKKDHVAAKGSATIFRAKLVTRSPQKSGKFGKMPTIIRKLIGEGQSDFETLTRSCNVVRYLG